MKTILITGGSRGIGAAAARACAARGLRTILTYNRHAEAADNVVADILGTGGDALALPLDVGDTASFAEFGHVIASELDGVPLHGLVNNAGFGLYKRIETVMPEEFDALFSVHLKGPFFLTQTLLSLMAQGSSVVNVTSATTRVSTAGVAPYAAFKGGLEILTRYQALEFGARRIRVNAISPGAIKTELAGGLTPELEKLLGEQTALGRVGEAEDIGRVIAALLAGELDWVNGQSIEASGGFRL